MANTPDHQIVNRFIVESKGIEGIYEEASAEEIDEFYRFFQLQVLKVEDFEHFVRVYEPSARLRDRSGLNVVVGNHIPMPGGPAVYYALNELLGDIEFGTIGPYEAHVRFETIHPFTDGNGRAGRMLWSWMMNGNHPLGFLHTWYYQSLQHHQK